jgi:non-ribosomal peptide synthetase component F
VRAIHRLIEGQVATNGDAIAIDGEGCRVSYRELNTAANTVARRLIAAGFRRGNHVRVRMEPSVDLAVVLLAILKAGGSYTWTITSEGPPVQIGGQELELTAVLETGTCGGSNLPVITRETDIACMLERGAGEPPISVPHGTVISMLSHATSKRLPWAGEPGALDLWITLMAGATAVVSERPAVAA